MCNAVYIDDHLNGVMIKALEARYSVLENRLTKRRYKPFKVQIYSEMRDVAQLLKLCAHKRLHL